MGVLAMSNTIRTALSLVFTLLTLAQPFSAQAAGAPQGPGGTGGMNTVKHKLIESFALEELPKAHGYAAYREKYMLLAEAAPALATKMHKALEKATIYFIPSKIAELPEEVTGLRFKTEQGAYQEGNEWCCPIPIPETDPTDPDNRDQSRRTFRFQTCPRGLLRGVCRTGRAGDAKGTAKAVDGQAGA